MRHRSKTIGAKSDGPTSGGASAVRKRTSAPKGVAAQLRERVKELTLMHNAARLLQGSGLTNQVVLTELAALLPPAWQFPDLCAARITFGNVEACTPGWRSSRCKLSQTFATSDGTRGIVEVIYLEKPPGTAFLKEERTLIASIAELLTSYFERRLAEDKIRKLAYYEPVTGLPNRASLEEQLEIAIKAAGIAGYPLALLLMNLSDFRVINNTLGHRNGDVLLRQVASGLREVLHANDLVASLGGDEFVILLARLGERLDIQEVVDRIEEAMRRPMQIAGIPVKIEGAIGVALYPEHGDSVELLWQHSDVALRTAKESHRGHLLYSREIDNYEPQHIALLGELSSAIETNQLTLHYQPTIDFKSGKTVGVEALVRWQHPIHGLIYPDRFIPLAERTQLINALTRWVLTRAVEQCGTWRRQNGLRLGISVNLSARNLLDSALCAAIPKIVMEAGLKLEDLTLEVTESAIMADPDRAKRQLHELHAHGIHLSMDDFGVGQSSLTYLKDLPIGKMKIDKSFVMGFAESRNAAIVRGAIELGHNLGMQITAEGVESEAVYQTLREFGCDVGQGYLFTRALPPEELPMWLEKSPWGSIK